MLEFTQLLQLERYLTSVSHHSTNQIAQNLTLRVEFDPSEIILSFAMVNMLAPPTSYCELAYTHPGFSPEFLQLLVHYA